MLWSRGPNMARHSFVWVRVHLVWSTYRRRPWLAPEWRDRLYRYLAAVARRKGALPLCIGGARDHIHVYVSLGPDTSVGRLVNALKANSCRWIHETFPRFRLFAWQNGLRGILRERAFRAERHLVHLDARGPSPEGGVSARVAATHDPTRES